MTSLTRLLLLVICAELAVGCFLRLRDTQLPEPPIHTDPDVAERVQILGGPIETAAHWRQLGEWHMVGGCFAEAELCHRVACRLDPNDATLARQWAFALERLARLDEANEQYRHAAELKPEWSGECEWFIGRNHLRAERTSEARSAFTRGIAFDPCRYELARLQLRAGETGAANATFRELLAHRSGLLQVHHLGYRLAVDHNDAASAGSHSEAARSALTKLTNPFDAEAGRLVGAAQDFGSAARMKQIRKFIEEGNWAEAESMASSADSTDPNAGFGEIRAEVAARRKDFAGASKHLDGLEARFGPSARIAKMKGDVAAASGDQARARSEWLRAAELGAGANLKDVHHQLAASFRADGRAAEADFHLARGHFYVGMELLKFGYADKSVEYFNTATKLDRTFADAWFHLGEARRRSGEADRASEAYRKCLEQKPEHGRAADALGVP